MPRVKNKSAESEQMERLASHALRHSNQIADLCQKVSFGLIGFPLLFMFQEKTKESSFYSEWKAWLFITSILGCFAIFSDYLQHVFALWASEEAKKNSNYEFNDSGCNFRGANWMRLAKQFFALAGIGVLAMIFIRSRYLGSV